MPKTPEDLYQRIVEINREANHHRGLRHSYGYNGILDIDLVERCLALRQKFEPPVRILDVGCGDGLAMRHLSDALARAGANPDDFECWGMGMNVYEEMEIPSSQFIESGLNACPPLAIRFHLVVSVFTFHYMWHKLEGVEKVYNDLLVEGGIGCLHFPGYLIRMGESPTAMEQGEATGNKLFRSFLAEQVKHGLVSPMGYRLVPYYSDDDDRALLAEFGNLCFEKTRTEPISFGCDLGGFALFTHGFKFLGMDHGLLTYVASHYFPRSIKSASSKPSVSEPVRQPYRISSLASLSVGRTFQTNVAFHAADSETVIVLCPGAREPLEGGLVEYRLLAERIRELGLGAVVRHGNTCDPMGPYAEMLLENVRRVIEFTIESAGTFCATATPRICILAYSACGGAAAAIAAEYDAIDSLLLLAPSYDVPRDIVEPNFRRFTGEVRVLIGQDDKVVLPQQAFWYYERADRAALREYVEVPSCGHSFQGAHNRAILFDAPRWAFGGARPRGFPPPLTDASEPMG